MGKLVPAIIVALFAATCSTTWLTVKITPPEVLLPSVSVPSRLVPPPKLAIIVCTPAGTLVSEKLQVLEVPFSAQVPSDVDPDDSVTVPTA